MSQTQDLNCYKTKKFYDYNPRMHGIYHEHASNPFIASGGSPLWHQNYLLLHNDYLRYMSGVKPLDQDVTETYRQNQDARGKL